MRNGWQAYIGTMMAQRKTSRKNVKLKITFYKYKRYAHRSHIYNLCTSHIIVPDASTK